MKVAGTSKGYIDNMNKNINKALEAGAILVEAQAQERAPVKMGVMMRSVTHTPVLTKGDTRYVLVGPGPEAPYAPYTELSIGNKHPSGIKPEATMPWLKPAAEDKKKDIQELMRLAIKHSMP